MLDIAMSMCKYQIKQQLFSSHKFKSTSISVSMLKELNITFFRISGAERTQSGLGANRILLAAGLVPFSLYKNDLSNGTCQIHAQEY